MKLYKGLIGILSIFAFAASSQSAMLRTRHYGDFSNNGTMIGWIPTYEKSWHGILTHLEEYKMWCDDHHDCSSIASVMKRQPLSWSFKSFYSDEKNKTDEQTVIDCIRSFYKLEDAIMESDNTLKRSDVHTYLMLDEFCSESATSFVHNRTVPMLHPDSMWNGSMSTKTKTQPAEVIKRAGVNVETCDSGIWIATSVTLLILVIGLGGYQLYSYLDAKKRLQNKALENETAMSTLYLVQA